MSQYSNRLQTLLDLTPRCSLAADIGADHAFLTLRLIREGIARHVLCTDLSPRSLAKAEAAIRNAGLEDKVTFLLGDGLSAIADFSPEVIFIAGLGGETIASILQTGHPCLESTVLILQPMSRAGALRTYLTGNGFCLEDEVLAADGGRIFPVLKARYTGVNTPLSPAQRLAGAAHLTRTDTRTRRYLQSIFHTYTLRYESRQRAGLSVREEDELLRELESYLSRENT